MVTTKSTKKIPIKVHVPAKPMSVEELVGKPGEKGEITAPKAPIEIKAPDVQKELDKPVAAVELPQAPTVPFVTPTNSATPTGFTPPPMPTATYRPMYRPYNRMQQGQGGYTPNYSPNYSPNYTPGGGRYFRPQRDYSSNYQMQDANVPTTTVSGFLEILPEGHGFLRPKFIPSEKDIYISQSQIRKFQLRPGDEVQGQAREPKDNERYFGLLKVEKVNGDDVDTMKPRPKYDDLVPIYPKEMIKLETTKDIISTRMIDLLAPIGFGQRGMIVSPPKAGKTTVIKEIANGITTNYPKAHLMAALIGERPEEVTDLSRSIKGEVIASHFDESPAEQTKVAEIALDRARRLVERGKDVIILLDSITRLARAYNLTVNSSGRTLSGGFDPAALYPAKRFLGAARKCEGGGSLTIIGTALVETGSRMDDLIYEEFKGTGNMELHLTRELAEKRVFPAIDVEKSGTRQEQLLFSEAKLKQITTLRNMLLLLSDGAERTMAMIEKLKKTKSNDDFLKSLSKGG